MTAAKWTEEWAARRREWLAEHRAEWERSTNPFYVWEAMKHCPRDEPLPDWVCDYLARCNSKLETLAFPGRGDPDLSPADATERIPEALGFRRRPNWNAIEKRRHAADISSVLFNLATGKNSGTSDHLVIGALAQRLEKSSRQIRNLRDEAIRRLVRGWRNRSR